MIFPLLLRKVYADKNRQETIVRDSGLDWILVRPSVLNNKPGGNTVRALTDLTASMAAAYRGQDVAAFVLDQVTTDGTGCGNRR